MNPNDRGISFGRILLVKLHLSFRVSLPYSRSSVRFKEQEDEPVMQPHPDRGELKLYLRGYAPAPIANVIKQHLMVCDQCVSDALVEYDHLDRTRSTVTTSSDSRETEVTGLIPAANATIVINGPKPRLRYAWAALLSDRYCYRSHLERLRPRGEVTTFGEHANGSRSGPVAVRRSGPSCSSSCSDAATSREGWRRSPRGQARAFADSWKTMPLSRLPRRP